MNEQKPPHAIEWTRVWGRRGYTSNPVGGCLHGCRWQMPDGNVAICYAERIAEKFATRAYPKGFRHLYWKPEEFDAWARLPEPSGIFLDSMSDLFGTQVPGVQIQRVINKVAANPRHIFFSLTKAAPRLRKYTFPLNMWVGMSTPPDFMGYPPKRLNPKTKVRMLERGLITLRVIRQRQPGLVTWLSAEPLSWPIHEFLQPNMVDWVVIGAASNGRQIFPPDPAHVAALEDRCDELGIAVFHKGNIRSVVRRVREEFPGTDPLKPEGDLPRDNNASADN